MQLGPIYSTSYRLASRLSNSLRAGTPVRTAAELQSANPILLCVPGGHIEKLVDSSFLAAIAWPRKNVLICNGLDEAPTAAELRRRGAIVGVVSPVPGIPDLFVISGDRDVMVLAKAAIRSLGATSLEVAPHRVVLFQSALTLATSLFTPLLETAVECLRQSGLEQPVALKTADLLFQHSLRGFKRAGRKSWSGPVALADREAVDAQIAALESVQPNIARYFRDAARFSFELYQTFPELTRYDRVRWQNFRKRHPS